MIKLLKGGAIGCGVLIALAFIGLMALGTLSPDTAIYTGKQLPSRFLETIDDLGLLEPGEEVRFFYSDGLFGIEEGFYFVSDRNLVLHSEAWTEPSIVTPLESITLIEPSYNDDFLTDSSIYFETDDIEGTFPLSSEKDLDRKFVVAMKSGMLGADGDS